LAIALVDRYLKRMPEPQDERRREERSSIELVVRYQRLNAFFADYARNISRGGTFVATNKPLPKGTEFYFLLDVPQLPEALSLRARVVWTVEHEQATKGNPAGMGIEFQYEDADERTRLEQFVEELIIEHLGPLHAERMLRKGDVVDDGPGG
jgi:type IV pilus assembly protein PilZ